MTSSSVLSFLPVYEAPQLFKQLFFCLGNNSQAMIELLPADLQGISSVIQIYVVLLKEFRQANRALTQLILILGRERENQLAHLSWFFARLQYRFVAFQDDVRICAARAKGTNSCAEGKPHSIHFLGFPLFHLLAYVERGVLEIDEFAQLCGMQGRHQLTVLHL